MAKKAKIERQHFSDIKHATKKERQKLSNQNLATKKYSCWVGVGVGEELKDGGG